MMVYACETMSVEEAGRILGISRNTAYTMARSGELPALRLRSRLRVSKVALDELLKHPTGKTGVTP